MQIVTDPEQFVSNGTRRLNVHNCEELFRRRTGGYKNWNAFLNWAARTDHPKNFEVECQFDAFAYSFLSIAKNADFQIPVHADDPIASPSFEEDFEKFFDDVDDLTQLEGLGIPPRNNELLQRYILAREPLSRPSARDERRIVVALFVSGSSTGKELESELGIYEGLPDRILLSLEKSGCVCKDENRLGHFKIDPFALGICYFLVRETLGFSMKKVIERYV